MRSRQRGMTLLEVIVASVILVGLVLMTLLIMNKSADDANQNVKKLDLDHASRELLNNIAKEIRMASIDFVSTGTGFTKVNGALTEAAAADLDNLRFQMLRPGNFDMAAFADADPNRRWNRRVWYRWVMDTDEVDNDADDDRDGLADEGRIEKTEEEYVNPGGGYVWQTVATSIVCENVPQDLTLAPGNQIGWLKFKVVQPQHVTITLRLEIKDPKTPTTDFASGNVKTFQRTVSTTVEMRNN